MRSRSFIGWSSRRKRFDSQQHRLVAESHRCLVFCVQEFQRAQAERKQKEEQAAREQARAAAEADRQARLTQVRATVESRRRERMSQKERASKEAQLKAEQLVWFDVCLACVAPHAPCSQKDEREMNKSLIRELTKALIEDDRRIAQQREEEFRLEALRRQRQLEKLEAARVCLRACV